MKVKSISLLFMLIFMAVLPFVAAKCTPNITNFHGTSTADIATKGNKTQDKETVLCGLLAAVYDEDYSDETLKAIAIILNTNYKADKSSFNLNDSKIYISKENADKKIKDNYDKIEKAVNSAKELYITKNKKHLYIPYSICSNGKTFSSDKYDYIKGVSSPWDCYSKNFSSNNRCEGVSLDGIDYLCKCGETAEEALSWYLSDFEIN